MPCVLGTVHIAFTVAECGYQCRTNHLCQPAQCNASHAYALGAPEKGPLFLCADKDICRLFSVVGTMIRLDP